MKIISALLKKLNLTEHETALNILIERYKGLESEVSEESLPHIQLEELLYFVYLNPRKPDTVDVLELLDHLDAQHIVVQARECAWDPRKESYLDFKKQHPRHYVAIDPSAPITILSEVYSTIVKDLCIQHILPSNLQ